MIPLLIPAAIGLIGGYLSREPKKYHLGGDMSKHLAPNGKPSNLTHEQWHLARTPEFKAWFGDWENDPENASKVIDSNGEPMVVWHTTNQDFNIFNIKKSKEGFFFSPNKERLSAYNKIKIKSFFLNIKKPSHELFKSDMKNAIEKGYDGIMDYGHAKKNNENLYEIICFYPTQIKLADGTNTSFDANNPDIRYAKGGRTVAQTPAPKKERIYGSNVNKPKSSASTKSGKRIIFSGKTLNSIKEIVSDHNKEYPNKKVPISTAKSVVRRGMGAYSSSHRPTISGGKPNSRVAWGLARLNAFIYKIQNGKSKSGKYVQDDDLINELGYKIKNK
jgi:hypothetical protein